MKRRYKKLFSRPSPGSPFKVGSDYDLLFRESRRRKLKPDELISVVARKLHKDPKRIQFDAYILSEPKHKSNGHKCEVDEKLLEKSGVLQFVETA